MSRVRAAGRGRAARSTRVLTVAALTFTGAAHAQPAAAPETAPGTGIDVLSHELEVTPDFQARSLSGRARIRLRVEQEGLREIAFSKNALDIVAAELEGKAVSARQGRSSLIFTMPQPLRAGQTVTLAVSYRGKPARGVTFTERAVFTSYWACDWMICSQDVPADKAAFQLRLTLPAGMRSLSVGTRRSVRRGPGGRTVHLWREERPYSAYLYGFAAGTFTEAVRRRGDREIAVVDATAAPSDHAPLLDTMAAMIGFLEGKAGVKLPPRRYSQLLVPGSEAQEAATYSIVGMRHIEAGRAKPEEEWALVHELAHQWWGNLVTACNWDHFWLNEGVVVFLTAAWKEHRFGRAAYEAELEMARGRVARVREIGFDKPLAFRGSYPSLGARRAIQYSKGALFLDHLRTLLGEEAFWGGLKRFTRTHAGRTADSRDFQRAFEQASGRDLSATFDQWVYGAIQPPQQ